MSRPREVPTTVLTGEGIEVVGFPFAISSSGGVDTIDGDERIKALIAQVLLTSPGERVMEPEFGCGLLQTLFEPIGPVTTATLQYRIRRALNRWLGELIRVTDVQVDDGVALGEGYLEVLVAYEVREQPRAQRQLQLRLRRE